MNRHDKTVPGRPARGGVRDRLVDFVRKHPDGLVMAALLVFFGAVYMLTLFPGIGGRVNFGDSAKWQYLWQVNGTPHPTGYPLYLLLTKVFGHTLTFVSHAYRVTVLSTVFSLATLAFVYMLAHELAGNRFVAALAAVLLGVSYTFWTQSTESEVYTLNTFFVSSVCYLFVRFHKTSSRKYLLAGAFVYAVSFGNHLTMITLLPGLIYLVLVTDRRVFRDPRVIAPVLLFVLVGMSQYLYLWHLSHSGGTELEYLGRNASVGRLWSYVTGGEFRHESWLWAHGPNEMLNVTGPRFLKQYCREFTIVGVFLGISAMGFRLFIKRGERVDHSMYFALLVFFAELIFSLGYRAEDIQVYYLPCSIFFCLFLASTLDFPFRNRIVRYAVWATLTAIAVGVFAKNYKILSRKRNPIQKEVEYIFTTLPKRAVLYLAAKERYFYHGKSAIKYYQHCRYPEKGIRRLEDLSTAARHKKFFFTSYDVDQVRRLSQFRIRKVRGWVSSLETQLERYLQGHLLILSVKDDASKRLAFGVKELLKAMGARIDRLRFRGSYAAVFYNGRLISERLENDASAEIHIKKGSIKEGPLARADIRVFSGGFFFENRSSIRVNGIEYSPNFRGINMVVFDHSLRFIKKLRFDTCADPEFRPAIFVAEHKSPPER